MTVIVSFNVINMAQVAIIVLLGFALVAAQQPDFKTWKVQNMKTYPDKSAENAAQKVYEKNVADIEKHNSDPKATYKQKVNSDSDKTTEELTQNQGSASMPYEDTKQKNVKSSGSSVTADSKWQEKMRKSMSDKKGSTDKASMPTSVDYSTYLQTLIGNEIKSHKDCFFSLKNHATCEARQ